jgi:RHS repeat-associated protein
VKSAVRYYSHAGQVVAYRTGTASTSLYFLMPDYQGTGDITVNAVDQTQYSQRWFEPFGAERVPNTDTGIWPFLADKGFVGGTKDPTGLTRLGAREYDTETGRFTSVDPVFNSSDPNSWTNYGYADENPVNNADAQGTLCYPVHTDQGTKTECLGPYGDSHPDNGETTTPPPPSTPNYTPSAPSAPPVEKKCGTWDFKCKAAKVWSEHKATIVSTAVGPGCGAVVGWTGVGAVGCGALAGTVHNLTVAADHTYYVLAGNTPVLVHNCTVYRGDQRSPAEIADAGGFRPKGGTSDLKEYVSSKLPSVFVSTTKKLSRAIPFTMSNKGGMTGYIYRIDGAPGGIDANKTIGLRRMMRNGFPGEREIAFEGGIESQFITACRKYVGGSPVGDWMPFP